MISSGFRHLQKATTVFHLYMVIHCFFQSILLLLLEFEWMPTGLWTDTNSELPQSQVLLLGCKKQCFELWVMFLVTSIALLNFSFWMNKIVFHCNQVAFPCSFFFRIWKKPKPPPFWFRWNNSFHSQYQKVRELTITDPFQKAL